MEQVSTEKEESSGKSAAAAVQESSSSSSATSSLCPRLWKSSKVHAVDYNDEGSSKYAQLITSVHISGMAEETPHLLSHQYDTKAQVVIGGDTIALSGGADYIEPFRLIDTKEYESNIKLDSPLAITHIT